MLHQFSVMQARTNDSWFDGALLVAQNAEFS